MASLTVIRWAMAGSFIWNKIIGLDKNLRPLVPVLSRWSQKAPGWPFHPYRRNTMPSVTPPVPVDQVLPKIVVGLDTHPCNWSNYLA